MDLGSDVVGHQPDDALAVCRVDACAGILQAAREPVNPQTAIRVEHDFDDTRVIEIPGDVGA